MWILKLLAGIALVGVVILSGCVILGIYAVHSAAVFMSDSVFSGNGGR